MYDSLKKDDLEYNDNGIIFCDESKFELAVKFSASAMVWECMS